MSGIEFGLMKLQDFFLKFSDNYWRIIQKDSRVSRLLAVLIFSLTGLIWAFHLKSNPYFYYDNFQSEIFNEYYLKFLFKSETLLLISIACLIRWFCFQFKNLWALRFAQTAMFLTIASSFGFFVVVLRKAIIIAAFEHEYPAHNFTVSGSPTSLELASSLIILVFFFNFFYQFVIFAVSYYKTVGKTNSTVS